MINRIFEVKIVNYLSRRIKGALIILLVCLVTVVGFSEAGILFSVNNKDVVNVTARALTFSPNKYVASLESLETINEEVIETTTKATTITTTTKVITTTTTTTTTQQQTTSSWNGSVLTKSKGVVTGPSGKETYYNLNMSGVVRIMRNLGYTEAEYPYWIREDGVKMLGNYVMVAANFNIRPRGTIVPSSLGDAIVCDTGGFAHSNPTQLDIAVSW